MERDTVLVIDDSMLICNIIEQKLTSEGINVLKALDGKNGIELAIKEQPDLILLDLVLPDTDGHDVCKKIKSCESVADIPIIFLTSKVDESSIVKAFQVGAIDYVSKPFSPIELYVRVQAQLESQRIKDALKLANSKLEEALIENKILAYTDKLTGLDNRLCFLENIETLVTDSKEKTEELWLMMYDIDSFKSINDTYGHHNGDLVLKGVASIIKKNCQDIGLACRWGGEEFITAIYGLDKLQLTQLLEIICSEIATTVFGDEQIKIRCTISIGASRYDHNFNLEENVVYADEAMYYRKKNGKNGFCFYEDLKSIN